MDGKMQDALQGDEMTLVPQGVCRLMACACLLLTSANFSCEATTSRGGPVAVDPQPSAAMDKASIVARLKSRYGGKISAAAKGGAASEQAAVVRRLMREWNPIGFAPDDVREIMGRPSMESESALRYDFDQGFNGWIWEFLLDDGMVTGVMARPID
jgi:hypothetical protein